MYSKPSLTAGDRVCNSSATLRIRRFLFTGLIRTATKSNWHIATSRTPAYHRCVLAGFASKSAGCEQDDRGFWKSAPRCAHRRSLDNMSEPTEMQLPSLLDSTLLYSTALCQKHPLKCPRECQNSRRGARSSAVREILSDGRKIQHGMGWDDWKQSGEQSAKFDN